MPFVEVSARPCRGLDSTVSRSQLDHVEVSTRQMPSFEDAKIRRLFDMAKTFFKATKSAACQQWCKGARKATLDGSR